MESPGNECKAGGDGVSLGTQETYRVSRDVGGLAKEAKEAVWEETQRHNGLVVFRVVACVLSTSHGTDRDTEHRKDVLFCGGGGYGEKKAA